MSNMGAIEAELYMLITGIITHLTAITAYHVGRTDLMRSPTAFRGIRLDYADKAVNKFLERKRRNYRNKGKLERFGWRFRRLYLITVLNRWLSKVNRMEDMRSCRVQRSNFGE